MNRWKLFAFAVCLAMLSLPMAPSAKADEWDKRTVLTINEPLQIPGQILQPGKYVMKLMDSDADRHIVQIFNGDESHLITTILAIPNYRLEPTGKTVFTYWETPAGQPPALRAWFYPGDLYGQEFAYKPVEATQLAQKTNQNVLSTEAKNANELKSAPVHTITPQGQSQALNPHVYTAPANSQVAQNHVAPQAPVQMASRAKLPRTASDMPLIGLIGLLGMAAGVSMLVVRRRLA